MRTIHVTRFLAISLLVINACDNPVIPGSAPRGVFTVVGQSVTYTLKGYGTDDSITNVNAPPFSAIINTNPTGGKVEIKCISAGSGTVVVHWIDRVFGADSNGDPDGHPVSKEERFSLTCHEQGAGG